MSAARIPGRGYNTVATAIPRPGPVQIPLSTADTTTPYAEITSGSLIVRGGGPILVSGRIQTPNGQTHTATIRLNGEVVATLTGVISPIVFTPFMINARDGDALALWCGRTSINNTDQSTPGASATWLSYVVYGLGTSLGSRTSKVRAHYF